MEQTVFTRDYKLEHFGEGPWLDEPDRVEWRHHGYACLARRNNLGVWCGYVAMPPSHPWHGKDYSAPWDSEYEHKLPGYPESLDAVRVHGGLTYAAACAGEICHVPEPGESDAVWWFGFDCGHCEDYAPGLQQLARTREFADLHRGLTYRDLSYVRREVESLADQARAAELG